MSNYNSSYVPPVFFLLEDDDEVMYRMQDRYLHYAQGVYNNKSDELHHQELLVRMKPDGATAFPEIQHLESIGKIHILDKLNLLMITEKLDLLKHPISINISAKSLENKMFLEQLKDFSLRLDGKANMVSFEITESAEIKDVELVKSVMNALKQDGVSLYADDFGSGYMNEDIIKQLPFDSIKLDRDIVKNLDDPDVEERAINIIDYAHEKGMSVVGEFIEGDKERDAMLRLGVELGQGYRWGMPKEIELKTPEEVYSSTKIKRDSDPGMHM